MANVVFNRIEDSTLLDNIPVVDGSFYVTGDGKTFIDYGEERLPVGGTPDTAMSARSGNAVENRVIKEYVDNAVSHQVVLTTDGDAVPTGRVIDGNTEYVKRIVLNNFPDNNQTKTWDTGINMTNLIMTDLKVTVKSGSSNWFLLPNNDSVNSRVQLNSNGYVSVTMYTGYLNGNNGYAEVYYYYTS